MLKRLCFALGLLVLATPALAGTVVRELRIDPADLVRVETADGLVLGLPGSARPDPGEPDLPRIPVFVEIPAGHRVTGARLLPMETEDLSLKGRPAPAPAQRPGMPEPEGLVQTARAGEWTPSAGVLSWHQGRMRGRDLVGFAVAPVQWNPQTGAYRLHSRFRLEVDTEPAAPRDGELDFLRRTAREQAAFGDLVDRLVGGGTAGISAAAGADLPPGLINSGEPFAPTFRPTVDGSPVDMVIVTAPDQVAEYQRLADFHTQTGLSAVVRTTDWIRDNYPNGVDLQETIRLFLRDAVSRWGTTYALLGGDTAVIPARYGRTNFFGGETIPTDLYYTDLDGSWNADGDAAFGEGWGGSANPGDMVDMFPDLWVGRVPSNDVDQAGTMVDKLLAYMETPPVNGYHNDMLFLGEVLFPQEYSAGASILLDGATYCEDAIDSLLGHHNPVRLYENYTAYPGAILEDKPVAIDSINAGFGLVHHVGHGFINVMEVGFEGKSIKNNDADAFVNGDETFLLYSINCTSGAIDFNCLAERFMINPNGGAVGVVASTRLDFPTTSELYQNQYYGLIFQQGIHRLGRTHAEAKIAGIPFAGSDNSHRWMQFSLLFFGDPATTFWTNTPQPLAVTHDPTFTLGDGTYAVDVSSGGPVAGATVALFKDGDAYSVGVTDGAGHVDLPFRPDLTGTFTVGVIKENFIPYRSTATVDAPGASPHLFAEDQEIDDDMSGASAGNGDGMIDAGETVELGFALRNGGGAGETAITATLSSADPYVSIPDNFAVYPDIGAGALASPSDAFAVTVSRDAPDRHEARCTLDVFGVGDTYSQEVILYVHAPVLDYWSQTVRDTVGNGNGNGTISANEDFAVLVEVRNSGLGTAEDVEVRLRSTDPAVVIADSVIVLGDIAPGTVKANPADGFRLRLTDVSEYHELRAVVVDAYGEVFDRLVEIDLPAMVSGPVAFGSSSSIALTWDALADSTLEGYAVYRAPAESGPFSRISTEVRNSAYYNDDNLPGLTRYYYRIAAIDSSGNEGPQSVIASATTSLPLHPEWPVPVAAATTAGLTLADLDGDGCPEIVGAGDEIYALLPDGQEFVDGDNDVRTLGVLSQTGGVSFWNTPAVADVDGDGIMEIAAVGWSDRKVHVVDATGATEPGWPRFADPDSLPNPLPLGSVCLADADRDGRFEVYCYLGNNIFAWDYDGTEIIDGDGDPTTDGVLATTTIAFSYGTPTVANIDDEPYREIIAGMRDGKLYVFEHDGTPYPGFPMSLGGDITGSPAVGDIDLDGRVEIVVGSGNSQIHAIRHDGSSAAGFPAGIQLQADVDSSPALGDLNGDGRPDVVLGASNGALFAFSGANGSVLPGFPVLIRDNLANQVEVRSSPVLADVDGDGNLDIVVGDQIGRIHGFDGGGGLLAGFPIQTAGLFENSPVVWDVDKDGLTEILVESFDGNQYLWDTPWTFNENLAVWPMFKRNQRNSGVLDESVFSVTSTPDAPAQPRAALLQNFPNPMRGAPTLIQYRVPEGGEVRRVELRVYDLRGRLVRTLVDGSQPPGVHELRWDGRDARGRPVAAGIYPYRLQVADQVLTRKMVVLR